MSRPSDLDSHLARIGAFARLKQLEVERARIIKAYPGVTPAAEDAIFKAPSARPRKAFSDEARQRMSEAARKRWASRKANA